MEKEKEEKSNEYSVKLSDYILDNMKGSKVAFCFGTMMNLTLLENVIKEKRNISYTI